MEQAIEGNMGSIHVTLKLIKAGEKGMLSMLHYVEQYAQDILVGFEHYPILPKKYGIN